MDIGVIDKLRFELLLGENCLKGVSEKAIEEHITMFKMLIRWSKESGNKLLLKRRLFETVEPITLIRKVSDFDEQRILASEGETKNIAFENNLTRIQVKWLFFVIFMDYELSDFEKIKKLFNSWRDFIIKIKKENII